MPVWLGPAAGVKVDSESSNTSIPTMNHTEEKMDKALNPRHLDDLYSSGLTDDTIKRLGFYSGDTDEVEAILGFNVGPGLVIPYPPFNDASPFYRVKPDMAPIIDGKPAKYLSPINAVVRAYIPPRTAEALKNPKTPIIQEMNPLPGGFVKKLAVTF